MNEYYIFTFGQDHIYGGHAVKVKGDYGTARKKMFDYYGDKWAFQYSEEEWEKMKNDPERERIMEKIMEVIE